MMTVCTGNITGTIQLECEDESKCCKLQSVTVVIEVSASTIVDLMNQVQSLANSYEAQGYPVLAHSMVDSGPNWVIGLTVGYCEGEQPPTAP